MIHHQSSTINRRSSGTILVTFWSARDANNAANPLRGSSFSCISSLLLQMPSWTNKNIQKAPGETPKAPTKAPQRSSGAPWGHQCRCQHHPQRAPSAPLGLQEASGSALEGIWASFSTFGGLFFSHFQAISHHHASIIKQQSSLIDHHSSLVNHLNDQHQSSMIIIDHQ